MNVQEFINNLDFNRYEREVLLFLVGIDTADARVIYKHTSVPKGRLYSVLNHLKEKGLIQIIPTKPKRYKIEDIQGSLRHYLEQKKSLLHEKIELVEALQLQPKLQLEERNKPHLSMFNGRGEHLRALMEVRNKAKTRLLQVAPIATGTFASNLSLYKALDRGVKVRLLIRKITAQNRKNILECIKRGAEVRALDSEELIYFLIKDNDEFILGLEDYSNNEERIGVTGRNKSLVLMFEHYFEQLWKKGKMVK